MFVLMTYDIGEERVATVLRIARVYLTWVQNSVFEGEITNANYIKLKAALMDVIDVNHDAIRFYILRSTAYLEKYCIGVQKNEPTQFL